MTIYVAGFLFSQDRRRVALIRKNRPDWQKGRLNGIGGHVEDSETPLQAMGREFTEEAGIDGLKWEPFCTLGFPEARVHFFRAFGDLAVAKSMTDEEVEIVAIDSLSLYTTIPNIKWLVPMALSLDADRADRFEVMAVFEGRP